MELVVYTDLLNLFLVHFVVCLYLTMLNKYIYCR